MIVTKKRIPLASVILVGILPSFLKKAFYRLKGYKIGSNTRIGFGSVVLGEWVTIRDHAKIGFLTVIRAKKIEIDRFARIESLCFIDTNEFILGEDSKIREQVQVGGLSGPDSVLKIGKRCSVGQGCYLNPTKPIIFEDDVALGGAGCIFTHASWQSVLEGYPVKFDSVTIHKNVYLAWKVFILPGIEIGENSTIGANSTITINIPSNSLASGSPVKIALSGKDKWPRTISDLTQVHVLEKVNDEFIVYLEYHKKECNLSRNEQYDLMDFGKQGQIIFIKQPINLNLFSSTPKDTYLFFEEFEMGNSPSMILQLKSKTRLNSNRMGEEYVRYLSRYGIRFDRLD